MTNYEQLVAKVQQIDDLNKALGLMSWDRETNMPKGGTAERIIQMTTLSSLSHEMSTSDAMGELISLAEAEVNGADYDSMEASLHAPACAAITTTPAS